MAERRTCIPNNEDNDKSTRRIRPRMCAEYPMHNIASLSAGYCALMHARTSDSDFGRQRGPAGAVFASGCIGLHPEVLRGRADDARPWLVISPLMDLSSFTRRYREQSQRNNLCLVALTEILSRVMSNSYYVSN